MLFLCRRTALVQIEERSDRIIVRNIDRPFISCSDGLIEIAMRVHEPGLHLVVQIGKRALLQRFRGCARRIEPNRAKLIQSPGGTRDLNGPWIGGVKFRRAIRHKPVRKRESLKCARRGVPGSIFETCAEAKRPNLVKPAVKNAERRVVVPRNHIQEVGRERVARNPNEHAVLCNNRDHDVAVKGLNCAAHVWATALELPPLKSRPFVAIRFANRPHVRVDMSKRRFKKGGVAGADPIEIYHPPVGSASHDIHRVQPGAHHF